jgi:enamine deaminase RidA (YjgF/YER057c/UK114 family)
MHSIRRVTSPSVTEAAPGLWSNCLVIGDVAYISGLTARGKDFNPVKGTDEYEQSKLIFEKIRALVEAAGGAMADVVKLTIFVTNIANREKVWAARREFFTHDFPCCSLVEVSALASPELLVEIEAVAYLGAGRRP